MENTILQSVITSQVEKATTRIVNQIKIMTGICAGLLLCVIGLVIFL